MHCMIWQASIVRQFLPEIRRLKIVALLGGRTGGGGGSYDSLESVRCRCHKRL